MGHCGTVAHKATKHMVLILSMTYILGSWIVDCHMTRNFVASNKNCYTEVTVPLEGCAVSSATEDSRVLPGLLVMEHEILQILAAPGSHNTRHPGSSKFIAQFPSAQCRTRLG